MGEDELRAIKAGHTPPMPRGGGRAGEAVATGYYKVQNKNPEGKDVHYTVNKIESWEEAIPDIKARYTSSQGAALAFAHYAKANGVVLNVDGYDFCENDVDIRSSGHRV